jgi:hypothetical protein
MSIAKISRITASAAPMARRAGDVATAKPPSVALVPLEPAEQSQPTSPGLTRPDPCFVAHLIAMAQQSPQTRILRRAATADVQAAYRTAYRSLANQNEQAAAAAGIRIRLTS